MKTVTGVFKFSKFVPGKRGRPSSDYLVHVHYTTPWPLKSSKDFSAAIRFTLDGDANRLFNHLRNICTTIAKPSE